jgi:hypothetical protein
VLIFGGIVSHRTRFPRVSQWQIASQQAWPPRICETVPPRAWPLSALGRMAAAHRAAGGWNAGLRRRLVPPGGQQRRRAANREAGPGSAVRHTRRPAHVGIGPAAAEGDRGACRRLAAAPVALGYRNRGWWDTDWRGLESSNPTDRTLRMPNVPRSADRCPIDIDEIAEAYVIGRLSATDTPDFEDHCPTVVNVRRRRMPSGLSGP